MLFYKTYFVCFWSFKYNIYGHPSLHFSKMCANPEYHRIKYLTLVAQS